MPFLHIAKKNVQFFSDSPQKTLYWVKTEQKW